MDEKATMGQSLRSTEDEETIDLMELARLLWAHAVQIVAAAVAAALICLLVCVFALTPKYQASINMIVNTRQDNSSTFTSDNFNSAKNLISTYAVIIKGNTVLNEVIDKLDLDMTYTELYDMVDVADVDATQIMKITVTDTDAERAGEIAQTIADIVPDVLVEKVEAGSCKAVSDVIIDPNKVFPQTTKYVVLAGLLGAVLVCGILVACLLNLNQAKTLLPAINEGANGSMGAIMNTACAVGFGSVVKVVPGFASLTSIALNMPGSILFSEAVAVNLLAGATGSASGGW